MWHKLMMLILMICNVNMLEIHRLLDNILLAPLETHTDLDLECWSTGRTSPWQGHRVDGHPVGVELGDQANPFLPRRQCAISLLLPEPAGRSMGTAVGIRSWRTVTACRPFLIIGFTVESKWRRNSCPPNLLVSDLPLGQRQFILMAHLALHLYHLLFLVPSFPILTSLPFRNVCFLN